MMNHPSLAGTTLAALLAVAMTPALAADTDLPARGPTPFSGSDAEGNGRGSQYEFNRAHTEREQHQQQYRQRQQQMYQEHMNMGSPGGMSRSQGPGGGRR